MEVELLLVIMQSNRVFIAGLIRAFSNLQAAARGNDDCTYISRIFAVEPQPGCLFRSRGLSSLTWTRLFRQRQISSRLAPGRTAFVDYGRGRRLRMSDPTQNAYEDSPPWHFHESMRPACWSTLVVDCLNCLHAPLNQVRFLRVARSMTASRPAGCSYNACIRKDQSFPEQNVGGVGWASHGRGEWMRMLRGMTQHHILRLIMCAYATTSPSRTKRGGQRGERGGS